jgi:hypothetical protein
MKTRDPPVTYVEEVLRRRRRVLVPVVILTATPFVIALAYGITRITVLPWACRCFG